VLADDRAMARRSLRLSLQSEQDVDVIADVVDLPATIGYVGRYMPSVLVLDVRSSTGPTLEVIRQLRGRFPETEVVVLTAEENPIFAQRAIKAGAIGFVVKDAADTDLLVAVRLAARGEEYVSPRVASGLKAIGRTTNGDGLTERETEITRLIALGHTSAEIACRLHLSRRTVETHRAKIHSKLGFRTRAELVQFALQRHLIGASAPANGQPNH
jgi:two-component system response regulator NreC